MRVMAVWVRLQRVKKHTAKLTTSTSSISSSFSSPVGGVNSSWKMDRRVVGAMAVSLCSTLLFWLLNWTGYQMKSIYKIFLVTVVVVVLQKAQ